MVDAANALLSAFLQVLFDRIARRRLLEFFSGDNLDEALLEDLKIKLLSVNAVLGDAEEKQVTDPFVESWVSKLREAVYDADDVLDQIATKASQSRTLRDKVTAYLSSLNRFHEDMKSKLEGINRRLTSIVQDKDLLGLKEGSEGGKTSLSLPTSCFINEHEVYGRRDGTEHIIDHLLLLNKEKVECVSVIGIVGMAGMGKTTLSQIVYNDSRVKSHFNVRSWVYISEGSNVFEVTKRIYDSLTFSNSEIRDLNTLQTLLQWKLNGKRFLLVLDDYWAENFLDWDLLKRPLESALPGSFIIVTTRDENVLRTLRAAESYSLPHLSDEACWNLFALHAFRARDPEASPKLKEIGEKIVKKCKGHPLAVKTLGSLLAIKAEAKDWNKILQSKMWDLPASKSNILPALRLSYRHLPGHLKRCFAYCSLFPKGYKGSKWNLIHLWMAEGLLPQSRNEETMEEVGEEYFHELSSRSFLQSDESSFTMHDLMNDLAQHIGGEFFHQLEHKNPQQVPEKVRHISFLSDELEQPAKFERLHHDHRLLRTFLPLRLSNSARSSTTPEAYFDLLLEKLTCLRVLSLSNYPITKLPDSIGKLERLRYLNLSHTGLKKLPDSVGSLCNLQTLLLSRCGSLDELTTKLQNLTDLRHLDISGTKLLKMPPNFGSLKNLQLLTTFVVSSIEGSKISELGALLNLHGALSIVSLEKVVNPADASEANLKEKKFLDDLELKWAGAIQNVRMQTNVLQNLQPHTNLKKLSIENYGGMGFPDWLGSTCFFNMVSLHLICCQNCSSLPPLGQLPYLKMLHIEKMTSIRHVNPEFFSSHNQTRPFSSLENLTFEDMDCWENWHLDEGSEFPSLQVLHIYGCPTLRGSLPRVPALQELELTGCHALVSLPEEMMQGNACLTKLSLRDCPSLESYPKEQISSTLKFLHISECEKLECFWDERATWSYQALEHLHIESSCNDVLTSFPLSLFQALHELHISDCSNLTSLSFPQEGLPTPNLQTLSISNCLNMLPPTEWGLHRMASLTSFTIEGGLNGVQDFPEEGLLPAGLTSLKISNLIDLRSLNQTGLQNLTSLKDMKIAGCNKLESLPALGFPNSFASLTISECSLLAPRCRRDSGFDWHLVSGLRYLEIDGQIIIPHLTEEQ